MRRIFEIQREAKKILTNFQIKKLPIPIKRIAKLMNITVKLANFEDDDISGMIFRDGEKVIIGINSHHPETRQRFTLGHEIGHFLLHDFNVHVDARNAVPLRLRDEVSSQGTDDEEIEANQFAAELLMPVEFVKKQIEGKRFDLDDDSEIIESFAKKFQVSTQAFTYRMMNLGVL